MAGYRRRHAALLLATPLAIASCATPPTDPAARAAFEQANDPLEPMNRGIFQANLVVDKGLIKPIALAYENFLPQPVRNSLHNFLDNLKQPVILANNLLQGEFARAGTTAARFTFNSTFGLAGLFDVATDWNMKEEIGDFGQTLYSWGVPSGPYLVLPLFGPTNPRDSIGMGVDGYIDPFRFVATQNDVSDANLARFLADGVDQRSRHIEDLDEIEKTSIDFYAQIRSLSRQDRDKELGITAPATPGIPAPDLYFDPGAQGAPGQAQ